MNVDSSRNPADKQAGEARGPSNGMASGQLLHSTSIEELRLDGGANRSGVGIYSTTRDASATDDGLPSTGAPTTAANPGGGELGAGTAGAAEDGEASPTPQLVLDRTKDLWQNISRNVRDSNVEIAETNLLVVGASGSGKTSLLNRIHSVFSSGNSHGTGGGKSVKPTTALDYSFARRTDRNVSQVAHFWELAQGTELAQLSEVVITPENIHSVALAVVVDCTEEGLAIAWETATYWLSRVDRRVSEIFQRMRAKNSVTPDKMIQRAKKTVGANHPDMRRLRLSGIPTVLVINKLDAFAGDTQRMKLVARSMRYLAHLYGAHLIFTSEQESPKWRALMSHVLFHTPFDAKNVQFDPERGGVLLTADRDSFADIGEPDVSNMGDYRASTGDGELDRWRAPLDAVYPPRKLHGGALNTDAFVAKLYDLKEGGYGEPAIDALRKQKDEELEQYKKSVKARGKKD